MNLVINSTVIAIVVIGFTLLGIIVSILISPWGVILTSIGLFGIAVCLKQIPADPAHIGLVTLYGKWQNEIKEMGWRFLAPFFPFFYDVIIVDITKKQFDLGPIVVRSKDKGELEINLSITFSPAFKDKDGKLAPRLIQTYFLCNKEQGIKDILSAIALDQTRQYAINHKWSKILSTDATISAKILGEIIGRPITTKEASKLGQGNGWAISETLGIVINRFNILPIKLLGKLAIAAEQEAKEIRETLADKQEINNVIARIKDLMALGYSLGEARDIVQTERGKVAKKILDIQGLESASDPLGLIRATALLSITNTKQLTDITKGEDNE